MLTFGRHSVETGRKCACRPGVEFAVFVPFTFVCGPCVMSTGGAPGARALVDGVGQLHAGTAGRPWQDISRCLVTPQAAHSGALWVVNL